MSTSFYDGYITGSVDASVVLGFSGIQLLTPLLPKNVELAPVEVAPPGQHPIYWSFNFHQKDVGTSIPGLLLHYSELAFVIPSVRMAGGNGALFSYPVVLYLNSWLGELGGRIIWQINKHHARCTVQADGPHRNLLIARRLNGYFADSGPVRPAASDPDFQRVKPWLDQPLLTTGWRGNRQSAFDMDFTKALIQPQMGEIQLQHFLPGFSNQLLGFQGLQHDYTGGFSFQVPWKLKLPQRI